MKRRHTADLLLSPVVVLAVAVLVVNDHVLKGWAPAMVTGKLSDFAGLVFFPLFLFVLVRPLTVRSAVADSSLLWLCILATGAGFSAVQLIPAVAVGYESLWGVMRGPISYLTTGEFTISPVQVWPDATDLVALPALGLGWRVGTRFLTDESAGAVADHGLNRALPIVPRPSRAR